MCQSNNSSEPTPPPPTKASAHSLHPVVTPKSHVAGFLPASLAKSGPSKLSGTGQIFQIILQTSDRHKTFPRWSWSVAASKPFFLKDHRTTRSASSDEQKKLKPVRNRPHIDTLRSSEPLEKDKAPSKMHPLSRKKNPLHPTEFSATITFRGGAGWA